ncbi:MAG: class I SAM-dependent methyltransferase [bacterium]|nr:class I SAM-dependent methyltransferase [bacterium]
MSTVREAEYAEKGDYHRHLDKNWRYYPIYVAKMERVHRVLEGLPKEARIADLGCGEGVLVEELRASGRDAIGVDLNYESEHVVKDDITGTRFEAGSFDVILCLDVLEHLHFEDQVKALAEIRRLLSPGGRLIATLPNLAHFSSRIAFLLLGKLLRTSDIERHPGDRPIGEYLDLLEPGFAIEKRQGIFPTFPLSLWLTVKIPGRMVGWHRFLNTFFAVPGWCFLNLLVCRRK